MYSSSHDSYTDDGCTDDSATYGAMAPGELRNNIADPFSLQLAHSCFLGHLASFELVWLFVESVMIVESVWFV